MIILGAPEGLPLEDAWQVASMGVKVGRVPHPGSWVDSIRESAALDSLMNMV